MSMMKRAALGYAERGWQVLPIVPVRDGRCGCGNPYCDKPGKHPLVKGGKGMANASSDPATIRSWWTTWPDANIAITMGASSGLVCIDLDIGEDTDGGVELNAWAEAAGVELPRTLEAETGSGGRHLVYAWPDGGGLRNATGWLPCVDVKAEGGYIIVEPSGHASGGVYRWLNDVTPAALTEPLLGHLRSARSRPGVGGGGTPDTPTYDYREACKTGPGAGARDHFFNARAFELRMSDWPYDEAKAEFRRHWEQTEQPSGNGFAWEAALAKLDRVWAEVEPEPLPDWTPVSGIKADGGDGSDGAPVGTPGGQKDTDVGNAQRFAIDHHEVARFTGQLGWLVWDGTCWRPDDLEHHVELAKATVNGLFRWAARQQGDGRDRWLGWAKQSESRSRIEAMVRLARTDPIIAASVHEFDVDPMLLCCDNGTLDLRTGELHEHRREDMLTKRSRTAYYPDASSAMFDDYLDSVTRGDSDLQEYLQRAAGYTLTGLTVEEVFFMIYGPKASGKSTFVDGMMAMLGDLAMMTQADTLTHMKGAQAPKDELASMLGARMVATVEINDGERFSEALVKQMTGGDKIAARHLYRSRFEFTPAFKLWIATNHAPRAYDDALWRRIKRVPFPVEVPKHRQDMRIKAAMKDPSSECVQAMLSWAVRGCMTWQQIGLGSCAVVEVDTGEYREEQDKFGRFLEERCVVDVMATASARDLYAAYQGWCLDEGERPMTNTAFGLKLKERQFIRNRSTRPIQWQGIGLQAQTAVNAYGL